MSNTTLFRGHNPSIGIRFDFAIRTEKEGDEEVIGEVYTGNCYHIECYQVPEGGTILDIGAHIGTFTVMAAQRFPTARIIAFEPNKRSYELLRENTKDFPNVITVNAAISYTQGSILTDGDGATGGGFMTTRESFERIAAGKTKADGFIYEIAYEDIPTIGIEGVADYFGIERVDLAKWDCEGGELDAFEHMSDRAAALFQGPMVGEYHVSGGNFYTFTKLAQQRFPNHKFTGRNLENMKRPIGAFFASYRVEAP